MCLKLYSSIKSKIELWHSVLFFIILVALFIFFNQTYFESLNARFLDEYTMTDFSGVYLSLILIFVIQLITFLVSHRVVVFVLEKILKMNVKMEKYWTMLIFNFDIFALGFLLFVLITVIPGPILFLFLIIGFGLIILSFIFNLVLMQDIFNWGYGKAFLGLFAVIILTGILYAINPYGFGFYLVYTVVFVFSGFS